jgi:tetratricopeptide (TPR) repeat protein
LPFNFKNLNRQQLILLISATGLVIALFFLGKTKPETQQTPVVAKPSGMSGAQDTLSFDEMLAVSKKRISGDGLKRVDQLEQKIASTADITTRINGYRELARVWMDSVGAFVPYVKYLGEAAKLENSEKSLTFAAHLMLAELPSVSELPLQIWMAKEARSLFEKAYVLNKNNDSTKVGLGSCFFFGAAGNEPPMKGIGMVREVAERNPEDVFAQYMLGVGASVSGQLDKAIQRFAKVVELDPDHMEARLRLADMTEQKGDKVGAAKLYRDFLENVKRLDKAGKFNANPDMIRQIEQHIETLK